MAMVLVSYDLRKVGRNYKSVSDYLEQFAHCKASASMWLLDTRMPTEAIRDTLRNLVDANDAVLVTRIARDWAAYGYSCATWLNAPERTW